MVKKAPSRPSGVMLDLARRPSIDLTPHNREWHHVPAEKLEDGDMVAGLGLVVKVTVSANTAVEFKSGNIEMWSNDTTIFAFVKVDG